MTHTNGATNNRFFVLLAEDEENDVNLIRRAFKRLGGFEQLMVVADGEATVSYLLGDGKYADRRLHPFPEVLFLDYKMPLLSGLGVLCWLRSEPRFEHLPVVVLSDSYSTAQSETIGRLRAACCTKPVTPQSVVEAIAQSVRRALDTPCEAAPFHRRDQVGLPPQAKPARAEAVAVDGDAGS